ncbi:hypothetical protein D3C87_2019500 [compost metagenome]
MLVAQLVDQATIVPRAAIGGFEFDGAGEVVESFVDAAGLAVKIATADQRHVIARIDL